MNWHHFVYLIVIYLSLCINSNNATSKINKRRLLLPYNSGVPTNYTLEILNTDNGCYTWTSTRSDVASVEAFYDSTDNSNNIQQRLKKCSTKAIVTVNSKVHKRLSTIIHAQDTLSSNIFRCDVEVDQIKSIEIVTTTKEIALEDVPDIIEVTAKDARNDTFTSLGGVEFEWRLSPVYTGDQNERTDQSINLKFRKFSDSQFKVKPDIEYWETRNSQGYMVLLEGVRTGSTRLSVRIKDKEYADTNMQIPEINLIVIANLALIPAHDVYLIPYANVHYSVQMIKSGKTSLIKMPSEQYVLELSNYIVASLNEHRSIVTAAEVEGSTSLILRDTNIIIYNEEEITHPSVDVFVAKPSYILLKVSPGTNFALQEFTNYEIGVEIYDQNHHSMYLSENLNLKVIFPSLHFFVNESTSNQAKHLVRTLNIGKCKITATLYGTIKEDGSNYDLERPLEIEQDVTIYPSLTVTPHNLLLPWDNVLRPNYDLQLRAEGATGSYRWQTTNINLTSVQLNSRNRESSIVSISLKGHGKTSFNVTDLTNYVFSTQVNVSVQPIVALDSPKSILETHLGEILYVPIGLYGNDYESTDGRKRLFDDCSKIQLNVDVVEKTRFAYIPDQEDNPLLGFKSSCKLLQFKCTAVGHSRVWISYENGETPLKTGVMISCHLPLRLIHPTDYALLALGTSIELAFEGGPKAWPLLKTNHYSNLNVDNHNEQDLIQSELIVDPYRYKKDLHVFRIECRRLGNSNLTLEVGNLQSATLPNPAKESISLEVFCDEPSNIFLKVKLKSDENCPLFSLLEDGEAKQLKEHQKIPVSVSNQVEIELVGRNSIGKIFNNLSSLAVNWNIEAKNNQNDEVFKNLVLNDFTEEINGANGYRKLNRNFVSIPAFGKEGNVLINTNLISYRTNYLEKQGISTSKTDFSTIKSSLLLDLVERPRIDRDEVSVFNYKKNKEFIFIKKGSGHFQIEPSSFDFANLTYSETLKRISLTPLKDGLFTIKVTDNCVDYGSTYPFTSVLVKIVNPKGINILVADKIELGKEVDVRVTLLDTKGDIITSKFHSKINLQPIISSDIATIRPKVDQTIQSDRYSVYTLKAEKVGTCSLAFKTGGKNIENIIYLKNITSNEKAIHVFEPIRIHPENLTLIVGSRYQVSILGGPQSDANNHFTSNDDKIVTVDSSGILNALKLGTTTLNVKSIGANNLIYSKFISKVHVLPLQGVKLKIPTTNLLSGSIVPAVIYGLVGSIKGKDTSLSLLPPNRFGTAVPNLKFEWIISNKNIIQLESIYSDLSLNKTNSNELNNFAVRIRALQPGEVSLKIIVSSTINQTDPNKQQLLNNQIFSDEITLKIIPKLELINIESSTSVARTILMSPNSHVNLKTSLDGLHSKLETRIISSVNNKIKLLPNSILRAEDFDEAIVEIRSHQEEAIETSQILLLKVICKPVSYLLARPISQFKFLKNDLIPIGLDLKFEIKYFDSIGNQFSSVNNNIEFKSSTLDSISFGVYRNENNNYDFNVKSLSSGLTTLKITDRNHDQIEDYLLFRTGQLIEPSNEQGLNFTVGDVVCFQSPVTSLINPNEKVYWNLDKKYENIVNLVEMKDNIALLITKSEGDVKIDFMLGTNEKISSSELRIRSPKNIDLDLKQTPFLSNSQINDVKKEILIPIQIEKEEANFNEMKCNSLDRIVDLNSPFTCELSFTQQNNVEMLNTLIGRELTANNLFNCEVIYSFLTNQNYLKLTVSNFYLSKSDLNLFLPEFENDISIQIYWKQKLIAEKIVPFYPSFKSNVDKIILSNKSPSSVITLQTSSLLNHSIEATQCNDKTRAVLDIYKLDGNEQVTFEVYLKRISSLYDDDDELERVDEPICLKLYSSLSKQTKLIPVELKLYTDGSDCLKRLERQPILNSNRSFIRFCYLTYYYIVDYSHMIISILITITLLYLGYHYMNRRSNDNNVPLLEMHHFSNSATKVSPFSSPNNARSTSPFSTRGSSRLFNYSQTATSGSNANAINDVLNTSISNLSLSSSPTNRRLNSSSTANNSSLLSPSSPRSAGRQLWSQRHY